MGKEHDYTAEGIRKLGAALQESRGARSLPEFASRLTQEIDRALHVDRITVLVPDRSIERFVAVDAKVGSLPADASLLTLVAGPFDPMDVRLGQPSALVARLPERDQQWLLTADFRCSCRCWRPAECRWPHCDRREEERTAVSGEDRWLRSAIASSGALAIENLQLRTPDVFALSPSGHGSAPEVFGSSHVPASECESCGLVLPPQTSSCSTCGGQIREAVILMVVRGTFRIDRLLGRGGMGIVYRALDVPLGRVVAVKTLPAVSPERGQQLRRGGQGDAAVAHPKLATIFAIELWRGTPMLIVEYFEGMLYDRLRRGPLAPAEAAGGHRRARRGARGAARSRILHRDVSRATSVSRRQERRSCSISVFEGGSAHACRGRERPRRSAVRSADLRLRQIGTAPSSAKSQDLQSPSRL